MMRQSRVAGATIALMAVLGLAVAAPLASAGGPLFDQGTVGKKYNFSFSGRTGDGSSYSAVGWFEANGDSAYTNVTAGKIEAFYMIGGSATMLQDSLSLLSDNTPSITLVDATNGVYTLFIKFADGGRQTLISGKVILDDPRGRSGKLAGTFSFFQSALGGGGVGEGEITAQ